MLRRHFLFKASFGSRGFGEKKGKGEKVYFSFICEFLIRKKRKKIGGLRKINSRQKFSFQIGWKWRESLRKLAKFLKNTYFILKKVLNKYLMTFISKRKFRHFCP